MLVPEKLAAMMIELDFHMVDFFNDDGSFMPYSETHLEKAPNLEDFHYLLTVELKDSLPSPMRRFVAFVLMLCTKGAENRTPIQQLAYLFLICILRSIDAGESGSTKVA